MDIEERINQLIKEQGISKREFASRLITLEPKLKSTGETPTEQTIYKYLNGTISIRIELIPYIAEALHVREQELFTSDAKSRRVFFINLIKTATDEEKAILQEKFDLHVKQLETATNTQINTLHKELITLLPYAPNPLLHTLIAKLNDIKNFTQLI